MLARDKACMEEVRFLIHKFWFFQRFSQFSILQNCLIAWTCGNFAGKIIWTYQTGLLSHAQDLLHGLNYRLLLFDCNLAIWIQRYSILFIFCCNFVLFFFRLWLWFLNAAIESVLTVSWFQPVQIINTKFLTIFFSDRISLNIALKMLSGPAAITGQLPGRASYNNSIDTDAYGEFSLIVMMLQNFHLHRSNFSRSSFGQYLPEQQETRWFKANARQQ